ncbi:flagellar protein export ATPase FliI [Hyphomicrobium sp.]|uniref:flagellar protein export ATPase FliI n=1 Tax=Hyphomicrobium sp. TaxID=82 RepID=UPI0025B90D8B|nr:flagellar protein export ATPase FliI [Hyphomicrobium sp.]MCC7253294.1 flagellar protein export ATPase FliI [Hyphomicrobium sp.]
MSEAISEAEPRPCSPASRPPTALDLLEQRIAHAKTALPFTRIGGTVTHVTPAYVQVSGLSRHLKLGDCIAFGSASVPPLGEVVRIDEDGATIKPFDNNLKIGPGEIAWLHGDQSLRPDISWKGRVLNALGIAIDGQGQLREGPRVYAFDAEPPAAMRRERVRAPLKSGVRVMDLFTPLCAGQRIGIFAGSGVGKSTLLSMLARSNGFDTVVLALVGERGREVREFLEDALAQNRSRAVTVVSTGDESPMMRRLAPKTALAIAEFFRDAGDSVLLIVDSVTRFAHATREVSLAAGEAPVARGYTPSVFSELPKLLERAGPGAEGTGSITGVFSVLVDGDDHNDPIADSIRGTLDGHIVLDRKIADQGRYPAVNVLTSVSRLANTVWSAEQRKLVMMLRAMISHFEDTRDLRLMGGYQKGADAELDRAIDIVPKLYDVMKQTLSDPPSSDPFQEIARALTETKDEGQQPPPQQR